MTIWIMVCNVFHLKSNFLVVLKIGLDSGYAGFNFFCMEINLYKNSFRWLR